MAFDCPSKAEDQFFWHKCFAHVISLIALVLAMFPVSFMRRYLPKLDGRKYSRRHLNSLLLVGLLFEMPATAAMSFKSTSRDSGTAHGTAQEEHNIDSKVHQPRSHTVFKQRSGLWAVPF